MSAKDNAAVEMTEVKKTESEMKNRSMVLWAILSLSMANALVGTGISPALGVIRQSFPDAPGVLVQMIVSLPSLMVIAVAIPLHGSADAILSGSSALRDWSCFWPAALWAVWLPEFIPWS